MDIQTVDEKIDSQLDELRRMVPSELRKQLDAKDFEETLLSIDAAIERGEDIWELVGDAASDERENEDARRWNSVDLAGRVVKRYGDDAIGEFAKRANISKRSAKERRTMGLFYTDRSRRANFLRDNPNQTYSHLRAATRSADQDTAYRLLERASKRTWTVDQFEYVITRWKGITGQPLRDRKSKQENKPLVDVTCDWFNAASEISTAFMDHPTVRDIGRVRVVIYPA